LPKDQQVSGENFLELFKKAKIFSPELAPTELTIKQEDQLQFVRESSVVSKFDEVAVTRETLGGYMELPEVPINILGYRPYYQSTGSLAKDGSYSRVGEFVPGRLRLSSPYHPELGCDFEIRLAQASENLINVFGLSQEDEKLLWLGTL